MYIKTALLFDTLGTIQLFRHESVDHSKIVEKKSWRDERKQKRKSSNTLHSIDNSHYCNIIIVPRKPRKQEHVAKRQMNGQTYSTVKNSCYTVDNYSTNFLN